MARHQSFLWRREYQQLKFPQPTLSLLYSSKSSLSDFFLTSPPAFLGLEPPLIGTCSNPLRIPMSFFWGPQRKPTKCLWWMEKSLDLALRTGGTAGSVVPTIDKRSLPHGEADRSSPARKEHLNKPVALVEGGGRTRCARVAHARDLQATPSVLFPFKYSAIIVLPSTQSMPSMGYFSNIVQSLIEYLRKPLRNPRKGYDFRFTNFFISLSRT